MSGDSLAAVEHFDGMRGDPYVDLFAQERVWYRVEEALDLDMIIDADASEAPFGVFVGRCGKWPQLGPLDRVMEGAAADAKAPHKRPRM